MMHFEAFAVALLLRPALVVVATALLAAVLERQSAAVRHALWSAAIIAILALPVFTAALPTLRIPVLPDDAASAQAPTARAARISSGTAPARTAPLPGDARTTAIDGSSARGGSAIWRLVNGVPLLPLLWAFGVLVAGAARVVAEMKLRALVGRSRDVVDPRLHRHFAEALRSQGVPGGVELRVSAETRAPAVAGVRRPVVLIPADACEWSDADIETVFAHELAHVSRRDTLTNLAMSLAIIPYWCNPAVRYAVRRLRVESERACDDRVLTGGAHPEAYAGLLIRLARASRAANVPARPAIAMARPRELESRITALLDDRIQRAPVVRWKAAALAGVAVLVALPSAALDLRAAQTLGTVTTQPEPDQLGDSLANPSSERLPVADDPLRVRAGAAAALAGPDSVLARLLIAGLDRQPDGPADLVRDRAAWALARTIDGRLVEPLLEALTHDDWRVRSYAAWAIAVARDARATPRLVPLLRDPVWRLRAMGAAAIRGTADPAAASAMATALTDPAWQVRVEAVEYFAELRGPEMVARLRPRLADRHVAVRLAAERALLH